MIANFISNPTTKNPSTCCLSLILFQTSKFSFQIANLTLQIPDRLQHLDAIYGCLPAQSRLRSSQHKGINRRGELLLLCFSQPHVIRVHYHDERIPLLGEHSLADDASAESPLYLLLPTTHSFCSCITIITIVINFLEKKYR